MTSTTVTEMNLKYNYVTGNTNAQKKQGSAFLDCFSQAYGGQTGGASENAGGIQPPQNTKSQTEYHQDKLQSRNPGTDKTNSQSAQDKKVEKPEQDVSDEVRDMTDEEAGMTQEVEEAAEEVIEAVASQLGISMEAVRQMMEQSGMTSADLLDAQQVTRLMLNLAGDGSGLELLTNAELYADVEQVLLKLDDVIGQLSGELGLEPEQLQEMIREAGEQMKQSEGTQETEPEGAVTTDKAAQPEQNAKGPAAEAGAAGEKANETGREEPVMTVENEKPLETVAKQETTSSGQNGQDPSGKEHQKGKAGEGQTNPEQLGAQTAGRNNMDVIVQELTSEIHQAPDTEQIMRQIMDYMKVQVKADLTQMEIQLHPSSLGNVNIQISSREGVITAQFTAQNETVKAALETQIVQLKETLAEQGVKVEAVEVTIASHSFERNLQQDGGHDAEERQEKKKGPKRLNLNLASGEDLDPEKMDDAEKIAADMMARNGNTVDFSA